MAEQDEEEPPSSRRRPWRRAPAAASNDDNIMTNNNFHRLSRSPDDQVALSYSDDDSGSLSDAYFFPPGRQQNPESNSEDPLAMAYSPEPESLLRTEGEPLYYPRYTPVYTYGSLDTPPLVVQEGQAYAHAGQGVSNAAIAQHERMLSAPESRKYRHIRQKQIEMGERERAVKEIRGTPQDPKKCRDATFAILFLLQLILVFFAAIRFGSNVVLFDKAWTPWSRMTVLEADGSVGGLVSQVETSNDDLLLAGLHNVATVAPVKTKSAGPSLFTIDYQTVISLCGITGLYACILSLFSVGFMLIIARSLIQVSLVFSILLALAWGTIGYAIQPHGGVVPIMGFVALVMLVMYTIVVWERIPFAATNLYMALCAMRCTADITLIGVGTLFIAFAWCLIWGMAFIGIVDTLDECAPGDLYCQESIPHSHVFLYIALLFSFAWTNLVIKNILRVTVASAIGTFWFRPDEITPCCTSAVARPYYRAITTSFGSICLGSLVVLPSQIVRAITWIFCVSISRFNPPREQQDNKCYGIFGVIRRYFLRCNRWSFCYIGMYGYSFAEAGDKAIQLFETRGWMSVVTDNLIHNVLLLASLAIGGSTGTFGVVVEELDGYTFSSLHKPAITSFMLGSVLGFVLSNMLLLGVVGAAVNTVLVCFAAGPFEFHQNHPILSQEMRDSWSQQVFEPTV